MYSHARTGVSGSSGAVCCLVTSSGDCRIAIRCFALPDPLAQLLDTRPDEVRSLVSELAQEAGSALAGGGTARRAEGQAADDGALEGVDEGAGPPESIKGQGQGLASMRTLSRISQDGGGGGVEARRPFREQVEEALELLRSEPTGDDAAAAGAGAGAAAATAVSGGGEGGARDAGMAACPAGGGARDGGGGPQCLGLESLLAFGPRNMGPNALFLPPSFGMRILWCRTVGEEEGAGAGVKKDGGGAGAAASMAPETEVALVDAPAVQAWVRSVAWPSIKNSVAVGFQMATASGM